MRRKDEVDLDLRTAIVDMTTFCFHLRRLCADLILLQNSHFPVSQVCISASFVACVDVRFWLYMNDPSACAFDTARTSAARTLRRHNCVLIAR